MGESDPLPYFCILRCNCTPLDKNQPEIFQMRVVGSDPFNSETTAIISDFVSVKGIDNFDPLKISLVIGHNKTAIRLSNRRQDHIQGTSWAARRLPMCH
jgi:hypothetical protein